MGGEEESVTSKKNKLEMISVASSEQDYNKVFEKTQYEGKQGHLLLQLQKTYKGDDRFKLDKDNFDIDMKEAVAHRKSLPQAMLGALSKREEDLLNEEGKSKKKVRL